MSKKIQTAKNIDLTHRLIAYLVKGKNIPDLPRDVSFVPFSKTDTRLNSANKELLESICEDDKPIMMAEEPMTNKEAWKLTPVNF